MNSLKMPTCLQVNFIANTKFLKEQNNEENMITAQIVCMIAVFM